MPFRDELGCRVSIYVITVRIDIIYGQVRSLLILASHIYMEKKIAQREKRSFRRENRCFSLLFGWMYFEFMGDNDMGETFGFSRARLYVTSVPDSFGGQNFCRRPQISCLAMTSTARRPASIGRFIPSAAGHPRAALPPSRY